MASAVTIDHVSNEDVLKKVDTRSQNKTVAIFVAYNEERRLGKCNTHRT